MFGDPDGFHGSTFFHRPPGERVVLGPIWDFDIAMGNTTVDRFRTPAGWNLRGRPYAERLYRDGRFVRAMGARWRELRADGLRGRLRRMVTSDVRALRGPAARNFRRWRTLGRYVWPNPVDPGTGRHRPTWSAEVAYLRRWLDARVARPRAAGAARQPPAGERLRRHGSTYWSANVAEGEMGVMTSIRTPLGS